MVIDGLYTTSPNSFEPANGCAMLRGFLGLLVFERGEVKLQMVKNG